MRCNDGFRNDMILRPSGGNSHYVEAGVDCVAREVPTSFCGTCAARCANGVRDGDEDGVDCGGLSCDTACASAACVSLGQLVTYPGVHTLHTALHDVAVSVVVRSALTLINSARVSEVCVHCQPIDARLVGNQQEENTAQTAPLLFDTLTGRSTPGSASVVEARSVPCDRSLLQTTVGCFGRRLERSISFCLLLHLFFFFFFFHFVFFFFLFSFFFSFCF